MDFGQDAHGDVFADDSFDNPNLGVSADDIEDFEDGSGTSNGKKKKKTGLAAKLAERKRAKNKQKAEKAYRKSFGATDAADISDAGPRAALYKTEMGSKQRKATRLQAESGTSTGGWSAKVPHIKIPTLTHRLTAGLCVFACIALFVSMLYTPAQQYYQQMRERARLAAEYSAIVDRNDSLQDLVDNLQSEDGIEDKAHAEFGYVKKDEKAGAVTGIDVKTESKFKANIAPGSVSAPETWYSGILDFIFGYHS